MKLVIQRVSKAKVEVDNKIVVKNITINVANNQIIIFVCEINFKADIITKIKAKVTNTKRSAIKSFVWSTFNISDFILKLLVIIRYSRLVALLLYLVLKVIAVMRIIIPINEKTAINAGLKNIPKNKLINNVIINQAIIYTGIQIIFLKYNLNI